MAFPVILGASMCEVPVKGIGKAEKGSMHHTREGSLANVFEVKISKSSLWVYCKGGTLTKGSLYLIKTKRGYFSSCSIPL